MILEVIEAKAWEHIDTGKRISLYGAVPYYSEVEKAQWHIVHTGWTWRNDNGSIGLGCKPAKTKEEAISHMERVNALLCTRKG